MAQKVEILITKERIEESVTVDEFIALQEGSIKAAKLVVGRFIVDKNGKYLDELSANLLVGKMSLGQLKAVVEQFQTDVQEKLVPNENSATSD